MKNIIKIILLTSSLILVGCNNTTNTSNYSGDCFLVDLIKDEYKDEVSYVLENKIQSTHESGKSNLYAAFTFY